MLLVALTVSLASVLDCDFVRVNIILVPSNFNSNFQRNTTSMSLGLWLAQNPDSDGSQCLSPIDSRDVGGLTNDDVFYEETFLNGDRLWSLARILALISLIIGFVDIVGSIQVNFYIIINHGRLNNSLLSLKISKTGDMDSDLLLSTLVKWTTMCVLRHHFHFTQ